MFKLGQNFYLKGTKQRFKIIDQTLGCDYIIISFTNLKSINRWRDYYHKQVTESDLKEKYILI